jgi:hypothetical protein
MSNNELVAKVASLYEAFGRGDLAAIQSLVSEDVWWGYAVDYSQPGVPTACGPFHGKQGVADYFRAVAENLDVKRLAPVAFLASGDRVAVLMDKDIQVKQTKKSYDGLLIHLFEFDQTGKIHRHVHFDDTAKIIEAYRRE